MLSKGIKIRSDVKIALVLKAWAGKKLKDKLLADSTSASPEELTDDRALHLVVPQMEVLPNPESRLHDSSPRAAWVLPDVDLKVSFPDCVSGSRGFNVRLTENAYVS